MLMACHSLIPIVTQSGKIIGLIGLGCVDFDYLMFGITERGS